MCTFALWIRKLGTSSKFWYHLWEEIFNNCYRRRRQDSILHCYGLKMEHLGTRLLSRISNASSLVRGYPLLHGPIPVRCRVTEESCGHFDRRVAWLIVRHKTMRGRDEICCNGSSSVSTRKTALKMTFFIQKLKVEKKREKIFKPVWTPPLGDLWSSMTLPPPSPRGVQVSDRTVFVENTCGGFL